MGRVLTETTTQEEASILACETPELWSKHRLPGIAAATIEMAYCNGGVNRYRRERHVLKDMDAVLGDGCELAMDLPAISAWLGALSKVDLLTVVDGEETDQQKLLATAPAGTDALLNRIFDEAV